MGDGVAADIGDAARLKCAGGFEELGCGAGARRVDGENVNTLVVIGGIEDIVSGIVSHKPRVTGKAVELGVATCVGNAGGVALYTEQHNAGAFVLGVFAAHRPMVPLPQ